MEVTHDNRISGPGFEWDAPKSRRLRAARPRRFDYRMGGSPLTQNRAVVQNGDVWIYDMEQSPETRALLYQIIVLPDGAALVSAEPEPKEKGLQNGRMTLRFERQMEVKHTAKCVVKYTL